MDSTLSEFLAHLLLGAMIVGPFGLIAWLWDKLIELKREVRRLEGNCEVLKERNDALHRRLLDYAGD